MQALEKIVRTRGGYQTLDSTAEILRLSILGLVFILVQQSRLKPNRIEVNGCLAYDKPPFFPVPRKVLHPSSYIAPSNVLGSLVATLMQSSAVFSGICDALLSVAAMCDYINKNCLDEAFWRNTTTCIQQLLPAGHEVLKLPRFHEQNDKSGNAIISEATRLACMLFLSFLHRKFEMPPDSVETNKNRLFWFLNDFPTNWSSFLPLRLWILVVLAVATPKSDRELHTAEINNTMQELGTWLWTDAVDVVRGIAWVDDIGTVWLDELGQEVFQI
jgi:hypothetical protein